MSILNLVLLSSSLYATRRSCSMVYLYVYSVRNATQYAWLRSLVAGSGAFGIPDQQI